MWSFSQLHGILHAKLLLFCWFGRTENKNNNKKTANQKDEPFETRRTLEFKCWYDAVGRVMSNDQKHQSSTIFVWLNFTCFHLTTHSSRTTTVGCLHPFHFSLDHKMFLIMEQIWRDYHPCRVMPLCQFSKSVHILGLLHNIWSSPLMLIYDERETAKKHVAIYAAPLRLFFQSVVSP